MVWQKSGEKAELPEIRSVGALDGDCFDINLSNGHIILLELGSRMNERDFAALIESGVIGKPQTDGERVYWPGGPSITLTEIFVMLKSRDGQCRTRADKTEGGFNL